MASEIFGDRFGARADVELIVDVPDVPLDGVEADVQLGGDFLIETTLGQEFKDLQLAGGETNFRGRSAFLVEVFDHSHGNVAGHRSSTLVDVLNGFEQIGRGGALREIAASAGSQGVENVIAVGKNG